MTNIIYNSRNYYRLLNRIPQIRIISGSTTVEITIGYLTFSATSCPNWIYNSRNYYRLLNVVAELDAFLSTTVEITIGYLTDLYLG